MTHTVKTASKLQRHALNWVKKWTPVGHSCQDCENIKCFLNNTKAAVHVYNNISSYCLK